MGHLIATDSLHQIFCSKKIDPLPFKSAIQDTQLLMDHRSEYIPPWSAVFSAESKFSVQKAKVLQFHFTVHYLFCLLSNPLLCFESWHNSCFHCIWPCLGCLWYQSHREGKLGLFWVFWPILGYVAVCLGARALPVEPLLAVDRRLLGCKRVGVTSHKVCQSAIRL